MYDVGMASYGIMFIPNLVKPYLVALNLKGPTDSSPVEQSDVMLLVSLTK
jgi:hypothetical protein